MTRLLKVPEAALRLNISEKTTWKAISSSDFATGIQSVKYWTIYRKGGTV
jgi:predicted DNA-binding transcriptional regulator AlpA